MSDKKSEEASGDNVNDPKENRWSRKDRYQVVKKENKWLISNKFVRFILWILWSIASVEALVSFALLLLTVSSLMYFQHESLSGVIRDVENAGLIYVGEMYEDGNAVKQDYTEAMKWYRMAAEQGDPSAQIIIGQAYEYGRGVKQDWREAFFWYSLGALGEMNPIWRSKAQQHLTSEQIEEIKSRIVEWQLHHSEN